MVKGYGLHGLDQCYIFGKCQNIEKGLHVEVDLYHCYMLPLPAHLAILMTTATLFNTQNILLVLNTF